MNHHKPHSTNEIHTEEIDVNTLHALRKKPSTIIIDVRERGEQPLLTAVAHRQIPMSVFPQSLHAIPEHTVVLLCQHGIRSLYAAELVQEAFGPAKEVYSLKGGTGKMGK